MSHNLLVAGGISHPFAETAPALAALWHPDGIKTEITFDVESGLRRLASERFDLLTVHCLRWSMIQHEKYEPDRAEWAFSASEEARQAVLAHLARGGGLLGIHTASIAFDTWPDWGKLLGAAWVWGRSHHPPIRPLSVRPIPARHPVSEGLEPFAVVDELYSDLALASGVEVLAEAQTAEGGPWQPVVTVQESEGSRRAYLALGHDAASIAVPAHAALLRRAARWCARLDSGDSARQA